MKAKQPKPFTGRHMAIIMLGFFTTVVAANLTMAYFASHSWTGLVVKNAYVASQQFDETTARLAQSAAVAVRLEVDHDRLGVVLTNKAGAPISAQAVVLRVGRPSHEGEDQSIALLPIERGTYSAKHSLSPGQWSGTITADVQGHPGWSRPVYLLVKG
jgi:nitrogen fixation protein FixH